MLHCAAWAVEETGEQVAKLVAGRDAVGEAGVVLVGHLKRVCIRISFL